MYSAAQTARRTGLTLKFDLTLQRSSRGEKSVWEIQ